MQSRIGFSVFSCSRLQALFIETQMLAPALLQVVALCLVSGLVSAGDWPEFRGPLQNGLSEKTDLPVTWSETENVRWFAKTKGLGWSSPVTLGDRIYFTSSINIEEDASADGELRGRQDLQMVCLNAKDGKEIFSKSIFEQSKDAPKIHNKNSHASPTPVIEGGRIFVHFGHQGTACMDLEGNKIWENRKNTYPPTHGNGGSPIVGDGRLVLTCDGGDTPCTIALDLATGAELWKTTRDVKADKTFSFCTPQLIKCNGSSQIISQGSNVVQSLSPLTGEVLWLVRYDGFSVVPRPVYSQGTLFICTGFNTPKLLAIDPSGTGDVTDTHIKWTYGTSVPKTPSILCLNNQIVMASDDGIASGIDMHTGKEIWRKRLGGNYSASPIASGDTVYFQSESGEALVLRIKETPEELSRNRLPGRIFASYSVIDQDLLIRSEEGIYRIGKP